MINELVEMLTYCRPAGTATEEAFIETFLEPLGVFRDEYGNVIKQVGEDPNIMWSSHTDTVHHKEGRVPILIDGNTAKVNPATGASCLGADCTTGVWLMMEMIRANKPGLYVFHRAEEVGCGGSTHIAEQTPAILTGLDACIAFDRYGTRSIITHQMGERGCSKEFAESLMAQLPGYQEDDGGSFTDSYSYFHHISECTNLSVGYYHQHSVNETQNLSFAEQLRDWLVALDTSKLVFKRDPNIQEYLYWGREHSGSSWYKHYCTTDPGWDQNIYYRENYERDLSKLVRSYPAEAADLMELYGISVEDFIAHIEGTHPYL